MPKFSQAGSELACLCHLENLSHVSFFLSLLSGIYCFSRLYLKHSTEDSSCWRKEKGLLSRASQEETRHYNYTGGDIQGFGQGMLWDPMWLLSDSELNVHTRYACSLLWGIVYRFRGSPEEYNSSMTWESSLIFLSLSVPVSTTELIVVQTSQHCCDDSVGSNVTNCLARAWYVVSTQRMADIHRKYQFDWSPNRAFHLFLLSNMDSVWSGLFERTTAPLPLVCLVPVVNFKDPFNFFSPFTLKNKDILLKDQEIGDRKGTSQRVMICNDPPTGINSAAAKNNETSILRTY